MQPVTTQSKISETLLIAGPPPASPPLFIAVLLVALSLFAPFFFLRAGSPSLFLGIAALALALAGIITLYGAVSSIRKRRADAAMRPRARISAAGITLHPSPNEHSTQHIAAEHIAAARLMAGALIVQTAKSHPNPGRYVLRYGKLTTPRDALVAALAAFTGQS